MRFSRAVVFLASLALATLAGSVPAFSQTYNLHFRSAQVTGQAGQAIALTIAMDNTPGAVTGLSFGVKHDPAILTLESVTLAPQMESVLGAGVNPDDRFYELNQAPTGGAGFTVGWILAADSAAGLSVPAGLDRPVFNLRYRVAAQAAPGTTSIEITGDLGSPRVPVILDLKGVSQAPVGTPAPVTRATVTISEGPVQFIRGDTNQSGRLDVTDAILIVDYLFSGAILPAGAATRENCLVAMNVDGSTNEGTADVEEEQDINITDAIVLLRYIFPATTNPPPPAAPFPACGQPAGQVAAAIACSDFLCK